LTNYLLVADSWIRKRAQTAPLGARKIGSRRLRQTEPSVASSGPIITDTEAVGNEVGFEGMSGAIREAVESGNLEMALHLLDLTGQVDKSDENYTAALERAVVNDEKTVVRSLLNHGCNVNGKGPKFEFPLQAALDHQNVEIVELLVDNGANVNAKDFLTAESTKGNAQTMEILLDAGADIEARGSWSDTQLILAVRSGKKKALEVLLNYGADINATGYGGHTALTAAIELENVELIQLLRSRGADTTINSALCKAAERGSGHKLLAHLLRPSAKGIKDQGCIAAAVSAGNAESIRMLLDAGADIETKWHWGNGPLSYAVKKSADIVQLLLDEGADINATHENGRTALTLSIDENRLEMVEFLLKFDPDTTLDNAITKAAARANGDKYLKVLLDAGAIGVKSQSCVAAAATAGNVESIKLLLGAGADIEAPGSWDNKPLILAVEHQKYRAVQLLLEQGANVNGTGYGGESPLQKSLQKNNLDVADILLAHGVDIVTRTSELIKALKNVSPKTALVLRQLRS
jgi:ankyrin repeat protein